MNESVHGAAIASIEARVHGGGSKTEPISAQQLHEWLDTAQVFRPVRTLAEAGLVEGEDAGAEDANIVAFQKAVDDGYDLFIPEGTWEISAALTWDRDQGRIFGINSRVSILKQVTASEHCINVTTSPEAVGVTKAGFFENFRMVGVGSANSPTGNGLHLYKADSPSNAMVRGSHLYITGFQYNVFLRRQDNCEFEFLELKDARYANVYSEEQTRTVSFRHCQNSAAPTAIAWQVGTGGNISIYDCDTGGCLQHVLSAGSFQSLFSNFESDTSAANKVTANVTISVAAPGVVTWMNHGFRRGMPIVFTTDGTLPTGLTAGTTYYIHTVLDADTFTVMATRSAAGSGITTSGSPSGTHTATVTKAAGTIESTAGTLDITGNYFLGGSSVLPIVYWAALLNLGPNASNSFGAGGGKYQPASASALINPYGLGHGLGSNRASNGYLINVGDSFDMLLPGQWDAVLFSSETGAVAANRGLFQYCGAATASPRWDYVSLKAHVGSNAYDELRLVGCLLKTTTGDPSGTPVDGTLCVNTFDNTAKVYADAAWRTIASGW